MTMKMQNNGEAVNAVNIVTGIFDYAVDSIYPLLGLMTTTQMRTLVEAMRKLEVAIKAELEYRVQHK